MSRESLPQLARDLNDLAWMECCLDAFSDPKLRQRFADETGIHLAASKMDRLVDEATGKQGDDLEAFVKWFDRNIWGEEMSPRLAKEKR